MTNRLLTVFFLSIIHSFVFAQSEYLKGFVILDSGDTLKGEIHSQINYSLTNKCEFRKDNTLSIYKPGQIRSYGLSGENRFFESNVVTINGVQDSLFLEYLVDGIVDLYYANTPNGELYFLKKNDELLPLQNVEKKVVRNNITYVQTQQLYKGVLNYVFADALPINSTSKVGFDVKSLTKITTKYHEASCDWECEIYRRSTKDQFQIMPVYTIFQSKMEFTGSKQSTMGSFSRFGVLLSFTSYKTGFFSFLSGLEQESVSFKGTYTNRVLLNYQTKDSLSIQETKICLPTLIKWNIVQKGHLQVFAIGGARHYLVVSGKHELLFKYASPRKLEHRTYHAGATIGFGVDYRISDKMGVYLQPYYERETTAINTGAYLDFMKFKNVGITTGVSFKL